MKFEIKDLGGAKKEIFCQLDFAEVQPFIQKEIEKAKQNLEVKGFRKGQAPPEIIESVVGRETLLKQAASEAVKHYYAEIIKKEKLDVLGNPEITITKLAWENPLELKAQVWIMPPVNLPDYRKIASQIKQKEISVSDKEIEESLKWLQKSRAKFSLKTGPAEKGDLIEIEYKEISDSQFKKESFVLGESHFIPAFEKNFEGVSQGEEKQFSVTFPTNYFRQDFAGRTIEFRAKIISVQKAELPEINDQWAQSLGNFQNLDALKKSIKEGIFKEKEEMERQKLREEILEKIAQETKVTIPEILIDLEKQRTIDDLKQRVPQVLQINFEEYLKKIKKTEKELEESLLPQIKTKVKKFLVLEEIKKREHIQASEEEITNQANQILSQYSSVEEAKKAIDPNVLKEYSKERVENQKTLDLLESLSGKGRNEE